VLRRDKPTRLRACSQSSPSAAYGRTERHRYRVNDGKSLIGADDLPVQLPLNVQINKPPA
jgi:hypothetical protein